MKPVLVIILCFFTFFVGNTQNAKLTYLLFGQIVDDKGESLPYVSIGVFNKQDSSFIKGAATEVNGKFSLAIPSGNYYAKISFLSFKEKVIQNISITNKDVDLKKIQLSPSVNNLQDFEVVEERKLMEMDLDKRVFNVDKNITNQGANATEILDNVPSVSVDVDGNVSLRGSGNVRILINGKPSGLTGVSTADALKQLQGSQIEKIEVITNPSSRYDAEGEVGIINIILKKDKREGINGVVNVDFGYPSNYGGGLNLTIKRKNFSVFTGYGFNYRDSPGYNNSFQEFTYPDTSFSYSIKSETARLTKNHNFRLGTEIDFNQYNSLVISGKGTYGDADNETNLTYSDFDEFDAETQTVKRNEIEDKDLSSYDLSLNYRKSFKQKDKLFTLDLQQSQNIDNEHSTINQTNNVSNADNSLQRAFNNEGSTTFLFQTDYIHPIKEGKVEMGLKSILKEVIDDYAVEEFIDSINDWDFIQGYVNKVIYNENVYAAYLMMGKKINKISFQLGVRSELSEIKTNLTRTNKINNRDYLNFFPSIHFSYELNTENSFQLSYSKRIQRPRHFYLLPFFSFSDSRNTFSGNPNLNPEYTDSYEVGHLKFWKKGSILSSIYYRYTTGTINWITFSDAQGITQRNPINLGIKHAFGIEFSGSQEITTWWNLNGSFNFFRNISEGTYAGVTYDSDAYAWSTRLNSKWTLKKKINVQAAFNYNAPQQSPQGSNKARYSLDAGFSFDLLKGNGTISFNAKDIFNTRKRRSISYGENFVSESSRQWRSRYFRVSFTYRINQKKKKEKERNFEEFDGGMG